MTAAYLVVVKRDCETCRMIQPVLRQLASAVELTVYTQDDPAFPEGIAAVDDTSLDVSLELDIETVPTLIRTSDDERTVGWDRTMWEKLTGVEGLGPALPEFRPGCASLTQDPVVADALRVARDASRLRSRRVELGGHEDVAEAFFERGWTDGLPVVPPSEARVLRMLDGTTRGADEIVAVVPPDLVECTVEKVAVNAVMAGCRPEYLPVVLACIEAACTDEFNMHGLLATTYFSGPVVIVNGPVATAIGMNSGVNALGQGNRANATIGRALQLIVRNVGGGRPGGVDRATLGNPGKYTFCFAEREYDSPWEPLSVDRGLAPGASAVTLFAGDGPRPVVDQLSRSPESLIKTFATAMRGAVSLSRDVVIVVSPEHGRVFREGGWSRQKLREELATAMEARGPGRWLVVHAGGGAGLFSAIIGSWVSGPMGSQPVTREVRL